MKCSNNGHNRGIANEYILNKPYLDALQYLTDGNERGFLKTQFTSFLRMRGKEGWKLRFLSVCTAFNFFPPDFL
jgi:hypothetical protein